MAAWLGTPPEPVAVLGAPGIGKSTICLAALHDPQVRARYTDRRWFVRCDGAASAEALLSGVAAELGVTGDGSPGGVTEAVCAALGAGLGVLVLDNFETPWTADPLPVEELLRILAAIRQAGLAVSSRGTGRPAGLRWRDLPWSARCHWGMRGGCSRPWPGRVCWLTRGWMSCSASWTGCRWRWS